MSERGVFAVSRGVFDHPLFASRKPFTRLEAWIWLISEANWKPRPVLICGKITTLQRGQLSHSLRFLAKKWMWEKDAVARFLTCLKTETMIETQTATGQIVLTICNYNEYQKVSLPKRDIDATQTATAARQQRDKEESIEYIESITKEEGTSLQDAISAYNESANRVGWPQVQRLTPSRKSNLRARLVECDGIQGWRMALDKAEASDFLTGRSGGGNGHQNWTMTFDFLVKSSSFTKLMEGSYDNRVNGSAKADPVLAAMGRLFAEADDLENGRR